MAAESWPGEGEKDGLFYLALYTNQETGKLIILFSSVPSPRLRYIVLLIYEVKFV